MNIYRYVSLIVAMSNNDGKTTILVEYDTRDKLKKLGHKDETYDDIINKLIRTYEKERGIETPC